MAVGNNNRQNRTYWTIINGKVTKPATAETPNAVKRYSEKKQKDVYELQFDYIEGKLDSVEIVDGKFGKDIVILFNDNGSFDQLTFPVKSRYFDTFCSRIPNFDVDSKMKIVPYSFESTEGKQISGLNIYQGGEKVSPYFTQETPNGFPEFPPKGCDKDEMEFFRITVRKFYSAIVNQLSEQLKDIANLINASAANVAQQQAGAEIDEHDEHADDTDDLPF